MVASEAVPTIDVRPLLPGSPPAPDRRRRVGNRLVEACEGPGVFQVVGHGIDPTLSASLDACARAFFARPVEEKARIAMPLAGAAWRGWFPVGGELTAGSPDAKEGLYFGTEHAADDPRVQASIPLHGANLFPSQPTALRPLVTTWMDAVTAVGRAVLGGIALGLGLAESTFDAWCADPTVLFRIFHYPAGTPDGSTTGSASSGSASSGSASSGSATRWGVGEHTDYGLLTLLAQDRTGGLEVSVGGRWTPVEPVEDALVCNLGDMMELLSGGRFVATPHRVVSPDVDRISMPLFLDPGWDVVVTPLPGVTTPAPRPGGRRWDDEDVLAVVGPYSDYLLSRVARVFPDLFDRVTSSGSDPRV